MKPIAIFLGIALLASPAIAQDAAPNTGPVLSTMIAGLEAQGYRVTDVDVDQGSIEVDALSGDGLPVELLLDPATGAILSETPDR